jgi:hypothetical protein
MICDDCYKKSRNRYTKKDNTKEKKKRRWREFF